MIGIIGSTNIDVTYNVKHFTKAGETQQALSLEYFNGGKGANQAVAAAVLLKREVYFCTCLGEDEYAESLKKGFDLLNIKGPETVPKNFTGRAFIEVQSGGENRIVIFPGANEKITPDKIEKFMDRYEHSIEIMLIQNEIPQESIKKAIEQARKSGKTIVYDPAPKENTAVEYLPGIDFLTPNETEFEYLYTHCGGTEKTSIEKKALWFKKHVQVKNLILKQGSKGSLFVGEDGRIIFTPAFKVDSIDSTAAGDIFNAAFAVKYGLSKNIEESLVYASAASAISVTRKGAQSSIPTDQEVIELIRSHT
jgi:ribokinase